MDAEPATTAEQTQAVLRVQELAADREPELRGRVAVDQEAEQELQEQERPAAAWELELQEAAWALELQAVEQEQGLQEAEQEQELPAVELEAEVQEWELDLVLQAEQEQEPAVLAAEDNHLKEMRSLFFKQTFF